MCMLLNSHYSDQQVGRYDFLIVLILGAINIYFVLKTVFLVIKDTKFAKLLCNSRIAKKIRLLFSSSSKTIFPVPEEQIKVREDLTPVIYQGHKVIELLQKLNECDQDDVGTSLQSLITHSVSFLNDMCTVCESKLKQIQVQEKEHSEIQQNGEIGGLPSRFRNEKSESKDRPLNSDDVLTDYPTKGVLNAQVVNCDDSTCFGKQLHLICHKLFNYTSEYETRQSKIISYQIKQPNLSPKLGKGMNTDLVMNRQHFNRNRFSSQYKRAFSIF